MTRMKQILCGLSVVAMMSIATAQSVFDMPKLFPQHRQYLLQFVTSLQKNDLLSAESAARAAVRIFPNDANWHYNVGCVCARDNRETEALEWLSKAVDLGFTDARQLREDGDLRFLRPYPAFAELIERAEAQRANPKRNATLSAALAESVAVGASAEVTAKNTQWNWDPAKGGYMTTLLTLVGDRKLNPEDYQGPYATLIQTWMREGTAAGNAGDL